MKDPVFRPKFHPPTLPVTHVPRPRLLQKLENGIEQKLTLIIARAGYGKSTLLAEWVERKTSFVWYSLDSFDRDPAIFFAHLLAGLRETWPRFGYNTQTILHRPTLPDPEYLTLSLLKELEDLHTVGLAGERRQILVDLNAHSAAVQQISPPNRRVGRQAAIIATGITIGLDTT